MTCRASPLPQSGGCAAHALNGPLRLPPRLGEISWFPWLSCSSVPGGFWLSSPFLCASVAEAPWPPAGYVDHASVASTATGASAQTRRGSSGSTWDRGSGGPELFAVSRLRLRQLRHRSEHRRPGDHRNDSLRGLGRHPPLHRNGHFRE